MRARRTLMESRAGYQQRRSGLSTVLFASAALGIAGCVGMVAWSVVDDHYRAARLARASKDLDDTIHDIARMAIGNGLKDPYSAKFDFEKKVSKNGTIATCGTVNSKNSFGAYTGKKRFVVVGITGYLEEKADEFQAAWDAYCA